MKKCKIAAVAVLIILIVSRQSDAQNLIPEGFRECGTVVSEKQRLFELEREETVLDRSFIPQANRPYWIPMAIHIVRRNDGTGGFTLENLEIAFEDLNRLWLPVGMQFYQYGEIDYINNDFFYNLPDSDIARDNLRQVNPVANTINVYFTIPQALCGESSFTQSEFQGIIMNNNCAGLGNSPSTWAHEVGHYFDLYHTHETRFGSECPSGSNCLTAGDLICDTPADPTLDYENNVNTFCVWTGTATPPMGCSTTAYNPPTRNIMSYSRRTCRDEFTTTQDTRALGTLATAPNRVNLRSQISRYVSPDGSPSSNCLYNDPCGTLARAVQIANPGDSIFMLPGQYPATTVSKRVTIRKWNTDGGTITVGQ